MDMGSVRVGGSSFGKVLKLVYKVYLYVCNVLK